LTSDHSEHFKKIIDFGTPVVFFDRVATDIKTSKVVQDDYNGAFEAVKHLVSSGYEKIAHISGRKSLAITQKRTRGYVDALKKYKLPIREEWITQSGFSQEDGEKDVYELLKCKDRPDAIFAVNDRKAIGAMLSLKKLNIRIGEEMGVIGFTNDPVSSIISPGLTTIAVPALEVGSKSCELLLKHISKKHFEPEELILPGKLIVRESTLKTPHRMRVYA
jgi:LacI family transcriptional regulator